ncbi:MAG: hypothetical protein M3120_01400 [Pseudomonadota bacterium]|nr:hypothetical protein [Pseudomonadota bacterium]
MFAITLMGTSAAFKESFVLVLVLGLHAAALFDAQGKLRALRAGVGGTMPMDKLNGWTILSDGLPLQDHHAAEWMGEF